MKNIRFLIMDVDGTLTDGKLYIGENGEVFKVFDVKDGTAIHDLLPKHNIIPIVISARENTIVEMRCRELGIIETHQACRDKMAKLSDILVHYSSINKADSKEYLELKQNDLLSECAYIGDDIMDLQCMAPIREAGGIVGCPSDAADEVKEISDYITGKSGGNGAVREFVEWIIKNK